MTIGFIGLGIMGSRMAANLLKHDVDLVVYNRTQARADDLLRQGAAWADTPAEVSGQVDVLFTVVAHPDAVRQVALGQDGFLDHLPPDALWVDCSTVNPSFSRAMAAEAAQRGVRFLDAPVAGTKQPAADGTLLFLVGGDAEDVETCRPYFDMMGREVIHLGPQSAGTSMKMIANLLLGISMLAFSEALVLGEALGLPRDRLLDALVGSPVVAPFIQGKREKLANDAFEVEFPLKWMHKDLHLAGVTGYEAGVAMPLENATEAVYALAARSDLADQDFSAIYRLLRGEASS